MLKKILMIIETPFSKIMENPWIIIDLAMDTHGITYSTLHWGRTEKNLWLMILKDEVKPHSSVNSRVFESSRRTSIFDNHT